MEAYKFKLKLHIQGLLSNLTTNIDISSIGENEDDAYKKLIDSLKIIDITKISSKQII